MVKNFLLEILTDPETRENLYFEESSNTLINKENQSAYKISEDVPVLIPSAREGNYRSPVHEKYNSSFDYAQHYMTDADEYDYFQNYESAASKNESARIHQAILNEVTDNFNMVLDAGCGRAWVADFFLPRGKKVISMDISVTNPLKALKLFPSENHAALVADIFNLPIKDASIDVIIAAEIIEHVYDPKIFVDKLMAALRPNGKLIIVTPYNEKLTYHLCVHCNKPTPANAHLHSFNEKNIIKYLPAHGIKIESKIFNNKYLIRLRIYNILSFLPFKLWFFIDRIANKLFKKPSAFLISITKL